jgi:hypothetical protein
MDDSEIQRWRIVTEIPLDADEIAAQQHRRGNAGSEAARHRGDDLRLRGT